MLRYKNSLLERILLEKGMSTVTNHCRPAANACFFGQESMSMPSFCPRRVAQVLDQRTLKP